MDYFVVDETGNVKQVGLGHLDFLSDFLQLRLDLVQSHEGLGDGVDFFGFKVFEGLKKRVEALLVLGQ